MARAVRRASASEAAPVTRTVISLVAPSPPRTMPTASGSQTCRSASPSKEKSGSPSVTPLAPFASAKTQSFVEHSPSTVIALNVSSTTVFNARCRMPGSTTASVVTNASMVAMFGSIMPDPFAIPPTRNVPRALVISTDAALGNGSVVMIARAASLPPQGARAAAAEAIPRVTFSISSATPITPVEATSTSGTLQPTVDAVRAAIASACRMPSAPVHAFAHPLLTTIARAWPDDAERFRRETETGAACARLIVKTPAADAGESDTINARSSPAALIPHDTPAARNPLGAVTLPSIGVAETPLMQAPRAHRQTQDRAEGAPRSVY